MVNLIQRIVFFSSCGVVPSEISSIEILNQRVEIIVILNVVETLVEPHLKNNILNLSMNIIHMSCGYLLSFASFGHN